MNLQDTRIAVLCEDYYEERELWYPYDRLREAECDVVRVGPEDKTYTGKHGHPLSVDETIDQVASEEFDGVVIPGGYAPDRMRRSEELIRFVRDIYDDNKMVAFLCHAAWVPISAGIVEGKQVTSFFTLKDDVNNAGAEWVDRDMVRDENLISSRNPEDLPAFCKGIISFLQEQ